VSPEDPAKATRIQEQPWWTSGSKYALAFIVASNVAVLLTIFVPEFSNWKDRHLQQQISKSDRNQQREIAKANQGLETLNRQVEVTRLLFDHFFGKPPKEQTAVIRYLTYQFPQDLRKKSLQAILVLEANPGVERQIVTSVAAVQIHPVGQSKLDVAVGQERAGFLSLIKGNLPKAKEAFMVAYRAYATYHNVDEISNIVLAPSQIARYREASPKQRPGILKERIGLILTTYSWGIPPDLVPRLKQKFDSLP
jgi:hypothetical protein